MVKKAKWHHLTRPRSCFLVFDFFFHVLHQETLRQIYTPLHKPPPISVNSSRSVWWCNKLLRWWYYIVKVNNKFSHSLSISLPSVPQLTVFWHPLGKQIVWLHSFFQKKLSRNFLKNKLSETVKIWLYPSKWF